MRGEQHLMLVLFYLLTLSVSKPTFQFIQFALSQGRSSTLDIVWTLLRRRLACIPLCFRLTGWALTFNSPWERAAAAERGNKSNATVSNSEKSKSYYMIITCYCFCALKTFDRAVIWSHISFCNETEYASGWHTTVWYSNSLHELGVHVCLITLHRFCSIWIKPCTQAFLFFTYCHMNTTQHADATSRWGLHFDVTLQNDVMQSLFCNSPSLVGVLRVKMNRFMMKIQQISDIYKQWSRICLSRQTAVFILHHNINASKIERTSNRTALEKLTLKVILIYLRHILIIFMSCQTSES